MPLCVFSLLVLYLGGKGRILCAFFTLLFRDYERCFFFLPIDTSGSAREYHHFFHFSYYSTILWESLLDGTPGQIFEFVVHVSFFLLA
ncbi:hypothetical protein QBC37DRAFT_424968 [Rhypophila decipiens]|uniref:Uncharacterized protein n=1 Tax=Rhypophila decipiens TaxID=261697 RepID=A0AAN6Y963_9PEZI|nr:hypothetical protein QBC37DRAFT_424968 [Rhypophila decipiens]